MEVKEGYKKTEVGVIPKEWDVILLSDITSELGDGIHSTPLYDDNGQYFFVNGNNICDGNIVITSDTKRINYTQFKKLKKDLSNRTILLSINGTIGNIGFYKGEPIILGKSAAYLNVKNGVSKRYVYYTLQTNLVKHFFEDGITGTTIKNLGLGTIRNTPILIPKDIQEQTIIATSLSDIDGLISALSKLIDKKKKIKQGAMQELLTGEKRLDRFSGQWLEIKLGDICDIKKGQLITEKTLEIGEIPVIAGGKQPAYYHKFANRNGNTITISASGANAGYVSFYKEPIFASDCSTIGESKSYDVFFIYSNLLLKQTEIFKSQTGGAQPHIHPSDLYPILIKVPPTIDEQKAIANVLSDMDTEIETLQNKLTKYKTIKQGMMQELLTGRIRLVEEVMQ